jgi:hypothetical protein
MAEGDAKIVHHTPHDRRSIIMALELGLWEILQLF